MSPEEYCRQAGTDVTKCDTSKCKFDTTGGCQVDPTKTDSGTPGTGGDTCSALPIATCPSTAGCRWDTTDRKCLSANSGTEPTREERSNEMWTKMKTETIASNNGEGKVDGPVTNADLKSWVLK